MSKKIFTAIISLLSVLSLNAQSLDSLFIDARGSFLQEKTGENYSSVMQAEYFNVHMFGSINDRITYRIRQRLNTGIDEKNPFRATDWLCLTWKATDRLSLYAGKTAVLIGGYEYDSAPIDVYYYSQFCTNLSQYFAFSVNADYEFKPGQSFVMQISNSPLSYGFEDIYAYNLAWTGSFAPWWKTIWSTNMVQNYDKSMINYVALGNHLLFDNLAVDVDLFHRASFAQERFFFTDYSLISKIIYRVGNWNLCTKFGYEKNSADNKDADGNAFDTVIRPGMEYIYGGCGVEYFPLGSEDIRLHLAYFRDNFEDKHNLSLGIKWRFDIVSK